MATERLKAKIKKGDEVIIVAGKDKGRRGSVRRVKLFKNGHVKVLVEGANLVKKHMKPNPQANMPGGIQEREAFLDISNVMLFDSSANKGSKVGYRTLEDGRKVRYFKSSGEVVDVDRG